MSFIKLGDLCNESTGLITAAPDEIIDYVDISSVDNSAKRVTGYESIRYADAPSRARRQAEKGCIIVSTVRPNLNAVAMCDFDVPHRLVVSTGFCVLSCKAGVDPEYVFLFCQSSKFIETLVKQATGASYPAVNDSIIRNVMLPAHSYTEQTDIALRLKTLRKIIAARQRQLRALDTLIKARFVEMFGDPLTNERGFETVLGSDSFKLSNGRFVPESKRFDTGIPVYGGNGISWYTDEVLQESDTIVVGRVGFQSGNVHLVKGPLWISDNAMYISDIWDSGFDLRFLYHVMEHIDFTRFQDAGDLKKITQKPFMMMQYIKPPLDMQLTYIAFVSQVDKSKLSIQQGLKKLETLKKSLMQQYFG